MVGVPAVLAALLVHAFEQYGLYLLFSFLPHCLQDKLFGVVAGFSGDDAELRLRFVGGASESSA